MEKHLFILLFFTGFAPLVLSVPRKYYLIKLGKTWSDAKAYCQATHSDLAIVQSNDNMVHLQREAEAQKFKSNAWIGMYNDINSWRWSLGNESLGNMTMWTVPEPNNAKGIESCGVILPTGWNDMPCTGYHPVVCFDGNQTGNNKYIYISMIMTWSQAQRYCRQYYTDLASARDATENSVIAGLTSGYTWFGLFRDTWKWTDQTIFSNEISWIPTQPDNAAHDENCGYLCNFQVGDITCSAILPFFCYSVITGKQQVIKVNIQSDQDVNDSAVNVAILKQIKQKLKDHGMAENITVKWREQLDGKVFHTEKEKDL